MSSVINVVCSTELLLLLLKEAEYDDDDEEFKRKSCLFNILRTIAATLRLNLLQRASSLAITLSYYREF